MQQKKMQRKKMQRRKMQRKKMHQRKMQQGRMQQFRFHEKLSSIIGFDCFTFDLHFIFIFFELGNRPKKTVFLQSG